MRNGIKGGEEREVKGKKRKGEVKPSKSDLLYLGRKLGGKGERKEREKGGKVYI